MASEVVPPGLSRPWLEAGSDAPFTQEGNQKWEGLETVSGGKEKLESEGDLIAVF